VIELFPKGVVQLGYIDNVLFGISVSPRGYFGRKNLIGVVNLLDTDKRFTFEIYSVFSYKYFLNHDIVYQLS
jgi:hypothetical protein